MSSHLMLKSIDLTSLEAGSYVVEIGSQRELQDPNSDDHSTCFLSRFAAENGLGFVSVDFTRETYEAAHGLIGDQAVHADGAEFLRGFDQKVSVLYLDNFDVVYNEEHWRSLKPRLGTGYQTRNETVTNQRSAAVHLEQAKAAARLLTESAFVCIDDTTIRDGEWWGKGVSAIPFLISIGFRSINVGSEGVLLTRNS